MSSVRWPGKYLPFRKKVRANVRSILSGRLLAIDPSSGGSSMPGYALYEGGVLKERGTIRIAGGKTPQSRLSELYECLQAEFPNVDVLAIEELRGRTVSPTLHGAVWVAAAAVCPTVMIEVPIPFWKVLAKITPGYLKDKDNSADDMDAMLIGEVVIKLAKEAA